MAWMLTLPTGTMVSEIRNLHMNPLTMALEDLPGSFAVWAASPEATFLHGRFVWAAWDVEELKSGPLREKLEKDANFLKVSVNGI